MSGVRLPTSGVFWDCDVSERWDLKMRRQLYEDVRKLEYDGGNL